MRVLRSVFFLLVVVASASAEPLAFGEKEYFYDGKPGANVSLPLSPLLKPYSPNTPIRWLKSVSPQWLSIDPQKGILLGKGPVTPGEYRVGVRAVQGMAFTDATIVLTVVAPPSVPAPAPTPPKTPAPKPIRTALPVSAPILLIDPLELSNATLGKPYSYDLSTNIRDESGAGVTYKIVFDNSGWLKISSDGKLSGTPTKIGNFAAAVEVANGSGASQNALTFQVLDSNQAPVIHAGALAFSLKERETLDVDLNDPQYVTSDASSLSFKFLTRPAWATLAQNGKLSLSPRFAQVGAQRLDFEVSDGKLSSKGTLRVQVVADPQKPVWKAALTLSATVETAVDEDISAKAQDPDGRKLRFTKSSGPKWLGITSEGVLIGTPADSDVGGNTFVIRASNESLSADATLTVTVSQGNRPPKWDSEKFALKNARALEKFHEDISALVSDLDGQTEPLKFSKVAGPSWVGVSEDGMVAGTPRAGDVGVSSVRIRAADSKNATAEATATITVEKANGAPRWTVPEPLSLGQLQQTKVFSLVLTDKVKDDEGDPITFSKAQGPGWLTVDPKGTVSGTPPVGSLGKFVLILEASDGVRTSQLGTAGEVVPVNHPPVVVGGALKFDVVERRVYPLNLNNVDYVTDADVGDKLVFSMSPVSWAELSSEGVLTLRPTFDQLGDNPLDFDVTDGKDVVSSTITVTVARSPRPPRWKSDPIELTATSGIPFSASLKALAEDKDGLPLTFSLSAGGPDWLTLDAATGRVKGTPTDAHAGQNAFVVNVKNDKLGADAALIIKVDSDNSPPVWRKPIRLKVGKADTLYSDSLKPHAVDPDPDEELVFEKVDGPAWGYITSGGLVIGTPKEAEAGMQVFTARVYDSRRAYADSKIQIEIQSKNNPPVWNNPQIALGNAKVGSRYSFDLSAWVNDADGDPLTFRKTEGPSWLQVTGDGQIAGTPREANVGEFPVVFEVSDGKASVPVDGFIKVGGANSPPVLQEDALVFSVSTDQVFEVELNQAKYVEDTEGDALSFSFLSSLPWISLSAQGHLKIAATASHKGSFQLALRVTDSAGGVDEGVLKVTVDGAFDEPKWLVDPIELTASVDSSFTAELSEYARDVAGLPLTYSKVSGPGWLAVNSAGKMTGRPTTELSREPQKFVVKASNGQKENSVNLEITVVQATSVDTYSLGEPTPSVADIIFVVDHTPANNDYYETIKRDAGEFFSILDSGKVQYSAVVLSSREFNGAPIALQNRVKKVSTSTPYGLEEFNLMIEYSRRRKELANSPIWALDKFFGSIRSQTALYQNEFYQAEVPVFIFVHSQAGDSFQALARGTKSDGLGVEEFAQRFKKFHVELRKPLELHVNDMSCDPQVRKVFQALASNTNGVRLASNPCGPTFSNWLTGFANRIVSDSTRFSKRRFLLSKPPKNPKTLKVSLHTKDAVVELKGNTGAATDKWHLDDQAKAVIVHWWNISHPSRDEKDEIVIEY